MIDVATSLRAAATHVDNAARAAEHGLEIEVPRFFRRGEAVANINAAFTTAVEQARLAVRELQGLDGAVDDTHAAIQRYGYLLDPVGNTDLQRQRFDPVIKDAIKLLGVERDRLHLVADSIGIDPSMTRAQLTAELDGILTLADEQISDAQFRRAAVLVGLPPSIRPDVPPPVTAIYKLDLLAGRERGPAVDAMRATQLRNLRLSSQARQLGADPSFTREVADAQVRAIIARDNADIDRALNDQLAVLSTVPIAKRPAILNINFPVPGLSFHTLGAHGWLPHNNPQARANYDALRLFVRQEPLLHDPKITRESVTKELIRLVSKPLADLTDADFDRISLLGRLPDHLRPPMPNWQSAGQRLEDLGLTLASNRPAALTLTNARAHFAQFTDPIDIARTIREQIDAGQLIDVQMINLLAGRDDVLAQAGLTRSLLDQQTILSMQNSRGSLHLTALQEGLRSVEREVAAFVTSDPDLLALRGQALDLVDRNLQRMRGVRGDTYSRHPDYTEVGRFLSIAALLNELGMQPVSRATVAHVGSAGEQLVW